MKSSRLIPIALVAAALTCAVTLAMPEAAGDDEQRKKDKVFIETLMRIESIDLNTNEAIRNKVLAVLSRNAGMSLYVDVVERFKQSPLAGHITLRKGERSQLAELAARVL